MDELLAYMSLDRDRVFSDLWNDAQMGDVYTYLLQTRIAWGPEVARVVSMLPAENFFSEPLSP